MCTYAILALAAPLACSDSGDDATGDDATSESESGASESDASESGETNATEGGTETAGATDTADATDTTAGGSDSSAVCGPYDSDTDAQDLTPCANPDDETTPGPGDVLGGPCCTLRQSCTGPEVPDGQLPAPGDVGVFMTCVDGVWTLDQTDCIESCHEKSSPEQPVCYSGCFWRPASIKPTCACVEG